MSFHGFSKDGVAVGGGADDGLKTTVRDAIDDATGGRYDVYVPDEGSPYAGTSPENFVNWLTESGAGVQIVQCWDARSDDWRAIADAVVDVYEDRI